MKNFLLLLLIGTACTINAQKLHKAIPLQLDGELISPEEQAMLDQERSILPDYSSSEATKITPGWVNVSREQVTARGGNLSPNTFITLYPDTTVKELSLTNQLRVVDVSGYGQTINFNNEALSASADFQFITNRDTVNVEQLRLNYNYIRSKTMAAAKSDSILVSYGPLPRDARATWVGSIRGTNNKTANNPKPTAWLYPKATGAVATHGFQRIVTSTDIPGLKTEAIALASGTNSSTINVDTKLIKDSLFFYYVTYKPAEFAPENDTIINWNNSTRAKYSSFRFSLFNQHAASDDTRYFDDQELTIIQGITFGGTIIPFSYTANFLQNKQARYGLTVNSRKINFLNVTNTLGINTEFYVSGNTTLSTNEKLAPKFAMAPNPASNTLKINFKAMGQKSIEIIDMVGRVINQYSTNNANSFKTNDISSLPNGFYFVKITNDLGVSATKKLIVSHH